MLRPGRRKGYQELFAVTSHVQFFERLGFVTFRRQKTHMFLEVGSQANSGGQRHW
jgi:N-acetylglutamate synthase-like GNAT family acetyltransferase